jgi:hypothetical protein
MFDTALPVSWKEAAPERAQLREFMVLFVIGSALTVAVFFLALWLVPFQAFAPFLFRVS